MMEKRLTEIRDHIKALEGKLSPDEDRVLLERGEIYVTLCHEYKKRGLVVNPLWSDETVFRKFMEVAVGEAEYQEKQDQMAEFKKEE